MPGDWKQMIQEKAIEAAVITAFNYVPGLVAKGITLARNGIEWVFGGRNEAEIDRVEKIGEVAEKAENVLAEYERKELMSWRVIDPIANKKRRRLGRQRMTSTVAELGEIGEEEESHEFCPGAGDPKVVGNESRSVSSKRKERGNYNYSYNYDDLMIMPSRGLEEDPRRFCTYKYGDDGRFTFIYSSTTTQFKWTYPGTVGRNFSFPFTFVSFNVFEGRRTCVRSEATNRESSIEAVLGTERCKIIDIVDILPRPYMLTVDAWADSSSRRGTFVFSVLPLPSDFDGHRFCKRAVKFCRREEVVSLAQHTWESFDVQREASNQ
ncbi:hypothetical protein MRB53_009414 [Persea americana]|uniref:Uncharacterized protein n=1 Tax=Persea americana TaxID=3435 RepID=A0ACC2LPZ1_PERAE|nr:hypothetical protein MRB53_009414 [Persea americana]